MVKKAILIRNAAATDFGGGERVPVFLARELAKLGINAIVFSGSQKLLDFAKSENVPHKKSLWWSRQNWSGIRALLFPVYILWQVVLYFYYIGVFCIYRPQTVHIQSKDDFIAGTFAAYTLHIDVFWSDYADLKHIWINHSIWYKNPVGKLVYLAAKYTRTIVVVSQNDKRNIAQLIPDGPTKNKLRVIYNGAFDQYTPTKKNKMFTFISTGRLVTDKGIGELIRAFAKLRSQFSDIQLQIIGDGPERKKFELLAKDMKDIRFLGHQTNPLDYLVSAHVFTLPTYHEGFSLALVEACMESVSIIATNVGGNPEIITDKENGLLVSAKSVEELYDAMKQLYKDTTLRNVIAKNARKKYVHSFDFKKIIIKDFLPLYSGDF